MPYRFDNLNDERFQEFCTSLVNLYHPNCQALPVGQPDGGRDALSYDREKKAFSVFQVKFVKKPDSVQDVQKWFISTIEGELEKAKKLIPKGAEAYYLLTNVAGSAHLDTGSIDRLNKMLSEKLGIPAWCWWQDDLSRKLDPHPQLKWAYPQILDGQDILNMLLYSSLGANKTRCERVINAYLRDQFTLDNDVKFRQIDLQTPLMELYTDVPIRIKSFNKRNKEISQAISGFYFDPTSYHAFEFNDYKQRTTTNAAKFLLDHKVYRGLKRILLEGGPGQGKSTISQYVCQVHRARLLKDESSINLIPEHLVNSPIRIPIKIDLRDVAKWLDKKNPYPEISEEYIHGKLGKSLEEFLIVHIYAHSKIEDFSINDFLDVASQSPILIVFDGFDEVADTSIRSEIVEFIDRGLTRLSGINIQILVTSRPAAISNGIQFPLDDYPHFELADLNPKVTEEYVEKWIKVNGLVGNAAKEIRTLSKEKLQLPHLRDLAKSPMQLAILLSLLNTRGESLPHKRTALYDSYVDLFFNRESEKNLTIRNHRDLIIDLHQYLAWILHSEAELYNNNGRIETLVLKEKLKNYLEIEGHNIRLVDELFFALQERVCAIVSRAIGSYEFEVQPLREYFCAKYLYRTSPYSPTGRVKNAALPDRFEAIAKNLYWQNVLRFFSGCFDKAQLPMLIDKIEDLLDDEYLKYTNYPRTLTSQLLSDWVFTQYPKLMSRVIKIVLDGLNNNQILNTNRNGSYGDTIVVPEECGGLEIERQCFDQLKTFPPIDYAEDLIAIIKNNFYEAPSLWLRALQDCDEQQTNIWLRFGVYMEVLHRIDAFDLLSHLRRFHGIDYNRIQTLVQANRWDVIEGLTGGISNYVNGILDGDLRVPRHKIPESELRYLSLTASPNVFVEVLERGIHGMPLKEFFDNIYPHYFISSDEIKEPANGFDERLVSFNQQTAELFELPLASWRTDVGVWEKYIQSGIKVFGDKPVFWNACLIAAGMPLKNFDLSPFQDLHNDSQSIVKRVIAARQKSGNISWWRTQLESVENKEFTLLVLFTWATPRTIFANIDIITSLIPYINIQSLAKKIHFASSISTFSSLYRKQIQKYIIKNEATQDILFLLCQRFGFDFAKEFIYENLKSPYADSDPVLSIKIEYLVDKFRREPEKNESVLAEIKDLYQKRTTFTGEPFRGIHYHQNEIEKRIPYEIAKKIMNESKEYPRILAYIAESNCRFQASSSVTPVGKTAIDDHWFDSLDA